MVGVETKKKKDQDQDRVKPERQAGKIRRTDEFVPTGVKSV